MAVSEESFSSWLMLEPQVIVWIPTHYRMLAAKGVRHGVRCRSCKMEDIIGLRYQCLCCLNYDLCQHCFFYGLTSKNHKLEHPMQEYCYRGSRKDATKAFIKLLVNNVRKRKISNVRQRYLCPDHDIGDGIHSGDENSSGFHSEVSSSVGSSEQEQKQQQLENPLDHTVVRQEKNGQIVISQQQEMFNSIVLHMENHNKQMMQKLKKMESEEVTSVEVDDCVKLQIQLNKLKSLMDNIFGGPGHVIAQKQQAAIQNSLSDPSHDMIESTPVVKQGRRSGVLLPPVDKNLSPITAVVHNRSTNSLRRKNSMIGIKTNGTIHYSKYGRDTGLDDTDGSILPSLTELSMADLSSLLYKTGNGDEMKEMTNQYNVTNYLQVDKTKNEDEEMEAMEDLELLMLKLDNVFQAFHDPKKSRLHHVQNNKDIQIGTIVGEIGDQIHAFEHQFRLDHEL